MLLETASFVDSVPRVRVLVQLERSRRSIVQLTLVSVGDVSNGDTIVILLALGLASLQVSIPLKVEEVTGAVFAEVAGLSADEVGRGRAARARGLAGRGGCCGRGGRCAGLEGGGGLLGG